jgi:hypothetical protein
MAKKGKWVLASSIDSLSKDAGAPVVAAPETGRSHATEPMRSVQEPLKRADDIVADDACRFAAFLSRKPVNEVSMRDLLAAHAALNALKGDPAFSRCLDAFNVALREIVK